MKATEEDRLELRQSLIDSIGPRSATVLMEALPPLDYEQLATKADLQSFERAWRSQFGELRGEFAELKGEFAELKGEFAELRADTQNAIAELRVETQAEFVNVRREITELRGDMQNEFLDVRRDVAQLRADTERGFVELRGSMVKQTWTHVAATFGSMMALSGLILGFG